MFMVTAAAVNEDDHDDDKDHDNEHDYHDDDHHYNHAKVDHDDCPFNRSYRV